MNVKIRPEQIEKQKAKDKPNINVGTTLKSLIVNCDECKYEFILKSVDIKESTVEINGVSAILGYFVCPKCNKIYRVSLKDRRYYELKEDLDKAKMRLQNNFGSYNKEKARVLSDMIVKKHNRLKAHINKVNKVYSGIFVFEDTANGKIIKYLP